MRPVAGKAPGASPGFRQAVGAAGAPPVGYLTDVGKSRSKNDDAYSLPPSDITEEVAAQKGYLYVVADGVGGNVGGDVASQAVATRIQEVFYADPSTDVIQSLDQAIAQAHTYLQQQSVSNSKLYGMATTVVLAVLRGAELFVGHAGDSRAFLVRGGAVQRLTRDHSLVELELAQGHITEEQARTHPRRNVILQALGGSSPVRPDFSRYTLERGDVVVLCSDGLWGQVPEADLANMVSSLPPQRAAQALVDMANRPGGPDNVAGPDNITVVIIPYGMAVVDRTVKIVAGTAGRQSRGASRLSAVITSVAAVGLVLMGAMAIASGVRLGPLAAIPAATPTSATATVTATVTATTTPTGTTATMTPTAFVTVTAANSPLITNLRAPVQGRNVTFQWDYAPALPAGHAFVVNYGLKGQTPLPQKSVTEHQIVVLIPGTAPGEYEWFVEIVDGAGKQQGRSAVFTFTIGVAGTPTVTRTVIATPTRTLAPSTTPSPGDGNGNTATPTLAPTAATMPSPTVTTAPPTVAPVTSTPVPPTATPPNDAQLPPTPTRR
jgi:protein phosphatase